MLAQVCGCAVTPAPPAVETRERLGLVTIVPAQYVPHSNFSTYAASKPAGAAKGAAEGAAGSAVLLGAAIAGTGGIAAAAMAFVAPYYIVTVAATSGVEGAIKSLPAEQVREIESALNDTLAKMDAQNALARHLYQIMKSEPWLRLQTTDAKGPTARHETATYASLRSAGIDTVTEIGVVMIGLSRSDRDLYGVPDDPNAPQEAKGMPSVSLYMLVDARLVRVSDDKVLADRTFSYTGPHRDFSEWIANDSHVLVEEFENAYRDLAEQVNDEQFLTTPIPLPNGSIWVMPSNPTYGVCWLAPVYPKAEHDLAVALSAGILKHHDACLNSPMQFGPVDSLRPTLRWQAFPRAIDREKLDPAVLGKIRDVTYDLNVWEAERCERGRLVYARGGLAEPEYQVEEPLASGQRYFWSFRARFVVDGQPMSTPWAVFNANGCNLQQYNPNRVERNHYYRFVTPP
jgi:hypothetical protein